MSRTLETRLRKVEEKLSPDKNPPVFFADNDEQEAKIVAEHPNAVIVRWNIVDPTPRPDSVQ